MKSVYKIIPIEDILLLPEVYPRNRTESDGELVIRYRNAKKNGAIFPPIVVAKRSDKYILIDGLHRLDMYKSLDDTDVRAMVYGELTNQEIFVKSIEHNLSHGKALHQIDLYHCGEKLVKMGFKSEEISKILRINTESLRRQINGTESIRPKHISTTTPHIPNVVDVYETCKSCMGSGRVRIGRKRVTPSQ